jgi:hypothetical protein
VASNVNLDALIPREDFAVPGTEKQPEKGTMSLNELRTAELFLTGLRKPDFQRETATWNPKRVAGLIKTFIDGELIPAVILWQHEGLLFVIDGSHRLSALIAWVHNDYGDGDLSRKFFDNVIPDEQQQVAMQTRDMVKKAFGTYETHIEAVKNPDAYPQDIVIRARRLAYLSLNLQWMSGDAKKAEQSFIRINQQAAMIQPDELKLIESRKKPGTIAARAIIRRGTGHKYWADFAPDAQREVASLATELHQLLFTPPLSSPISSDEVPAGGGVYAATALPMISNFVTLCNGSEEQANDDDGVKTLAYLTRCRKVLRMLVSDHISSLGLHPAVYFYSWTGKQQPVLFLTVASIMVEMEQKNRLPKFTRVRSKLESFLVENRSLINQVVRKYGSSTSGAKQLRNFYTDLIQLLWDNTAVSELTAKLMLKYTFLQPEEKPYEGQAGGRASGKVKAGVIMKTHLLGSPRCPICSGFVPPQANSVDHKLGRASGGTAAAENLQLTHPYCNSNKEQLLAMMQGADQD